jgi:hypothetical protein
VIQRALLLAILFTSVAAAASRAAEQSPPFPVPEPTAKVIPNDHTRYLRNLLRVRDGGAVRLKARTELDPVTGTHVVVPYQLNDTLFITANHATIEVEGMVLIDWVGPPDRPAIVNTGTWFTTFGGPGYIKLMCWKKNPLHTGYVQRNRPLADQKKDLRAATRNTVSNLLVISGDWGGLLHDGFRIEPAPGEFRKRESDRNNEWHEFANCTSLGAGHAGFHIPDNNTMSLENTLTRCFFGSNGDVAEEMPRFGIKVVSGTLHVTGARFSGNQLDIFLVRLNRPMHFTDCTSERSLRMYDETRHPQGQRLDFVRCAFYSPNAPADREVMTFRKGGRRRVGIDVEFLLLHKPGEAPVQPVIRSEKGEQVLFVHPATDAEVVSGNSPLPTPIDPKELLPF